MVTSSKYEVAGVRAAMVSLQRGLQQMDVLRTAAALARLSQCNGVDWHGGNFASATPDNLRH
ncbi:hypothetical protein DIJ64_08825 [Mycobacterium leprae]|uniref:Uncharacterized protein n=1 Tax=Mycobacterium leprae TaxID=1769 RepID=A0AAD0P8B1_MYCLR|nr:hypothetical protein DIJ64_08825 [Mycobacterium leprae]OAR21630.1 hypothetical protein A8144_05090 [Mycobacterium leprae 3125609]